jgi:hypothetical protein
MRHPTKEQSEGACAQKAADFGLTARALKFARVFAETPDCTISDAARAAGFSDRARGAHVRGCELMRDRAGVGKPCRMQVGSDNVSCHDDAAASGSAARP